MKKIVIIGASGAGKSTLAIQLHQKLGLPLYHLDLLHWKPNWVRMPKQDWIDLQEKLVHEPEWIIDGNYKGTLEIRLQAADTIIFLDFSSVLCFWGILKRFAIQKRIDEIPGCREKLNFDFVQWVWNYRRKDAPGILRTLQELSSSKNIFIFKKRRQLTRFVESLPLDSARNVLQ